MRYAPFLILGSIGFLVFLFFGGCGRIGFLVFLGLWAYITFLFSSALNFLVRGRG